MIVDALSFLGQGIAGAMLQFQRVIDGIPGSQMLIISSVTMFMTIRYLLRPFLGASMGSDSVKKKNSVQSKKKQE